MNDTSALSPTVGTATTPASSAAGGALWALLVGVDRYAAVTPLRGCVSDVQAMRGFLLDHLGVPGDHVRVLADEQATRAGILRAFREFLIENPAVEHGDQILFHFSGHGSQMRDPTGQEPDGLNETLVAQDSRTPGIFDIPDKTLAALLEQLAAEKGDNITVILDCCHSGSGTRKLSGSGAALVRRAPIDERIPPADLDLEVQSSMFKVQGEDKAGATRGAGPSGWAAAGFPYVLLAGCRDREESNEYWAQASGASGANGGGGGNQEGSWHGALTYFTLQALTSRSGPDTTYADLHEWVAAQVSALYPAQSPQCEGARTRVVFGGARIERDPFVVVQRADGQSVTLGAGTLSGLRQGTQLAVFAPTARSRADRPAPLATVEVTHATATSAQARVLAATGQPGAGALPQIPVGARALVTQQAYGGTRQAVALEAAADAAPTEVEQNRQALDQVRQAILTSAGGGPSAYLEVASESAAAADLRVVVTQGQLRICGANGELLVVPEDLESTGAAGAGDARVVVRALEAVARYRGLLALANAEPGSALAGRVRLRLRRYVEGPGGPVAEDLPPGAVGQSGELTVTYDPDDPARNRYVVDVFNASGVPVYPVLFTLSADYAIHQLYPALGQQEALRPGGTLSAGLRASEERLEFYLPDGWDASRDFVKAIVTTSPADLTALQQGGLNVPPPPRAAARGGASALEQLLVDALAGGGLRHTRPSQSAAQDDWTVAELAITTVRAARPTPLDAGAARVSLAGLTLTKPAGFTGSVAVTTLGHATRGAGAEPGLRPPPSLERHPRLFAPATAVGTRGVGSAELVLEVEADEASRRSLSPQNPLRLELPLAPDEEVVDALPVAFDGEDYLLVGYASSPADAAPRSAMGRSIAVDVVSLPVPTAGPQGLPTTRGIVRTVKLFVYKKLGRPTTLTGLRTAQPGDAGPVYGEVRKDQFLAGQRVAVLVHGLNSDSEWMAQDLARSLRADVLPYDHVLTWDYETFGTGIAESGARLAKALREQCGFGAQDGITVHVYGHSMGAIVSRCMVELAGGHEFVDALVLAGPPNRGTILVQLGRGLVYLTTVLLNHWSVMPPVAAVNWLAKFLYEQGVGFADLAKDSALLQQLNGLQEPAGVPYLVLAGENVLDEAARARFDRIAQKVLDRGLDTLFGEQNDVAIGLTSLREVRGGAYAELTVHVLPCDHFSYFATPQAMDVIRRWVAERTA